MVDQELYTRMKADLSIAPKRTHTQDRKLKHFKGTVYDEQRT